MIDPLSGQVLAYRALRDAYTRFRAKGATGHDLGESFRTYKQIHDAAGMDELYSIEERSTENGWSGKSAVTRAGSRRVVR